MSSAVPASTVATGLTRTRLARFPEIHWPALKAFTRGSPRLTDLTETFPLLALLIATGYGPADKRQAAIRKAEAGRPLSEVAHTLALPVCLRRIPPEACVAPLPFVSWGTGAGRWLGNQLPEDALAATWLEVVFHAAYAAGSDFATWAGRARAIWAEPGFRPQLLQPLALYAWHSTHPDSTLAWLAFTKFDTKASVATVTTETRLWLNRVKLMLYYDDCQIADTWVAGGTVDGFEFTPLRDFWEVLEERMDMRNCLDCYADRLHGNRCRVFGIRHRGRKVATVEIAPRGARLGRIARDFGFEIVQLKGPGNVDSTLDVWHATARWLEGQAPHRRPAGLTGPPAQVRANLKLKRVMTPYRADMAARNGPGAEAVAATLADLDGAIREVARRARVPGWIFHNS